MGKVEVVMFASSSRQLHHLAAKDDDNVTFPLPLHSLCFAPAFLDEPGVQSDDHSLAAKHPVTALNCWAEMPMVVVDN